MPADQAFLDRINRIERGKTWAPDGVVVDKRRKKRKKVDINARQKRVSFLLSLTVLWGLGWVFAQVQPELFAQFAAGDFSSVTGLFESLSAAQTSTDA